NRGSAIETRLVEVSGVKLQANVAARQLNSQRLAEAMTGRNCGKLRIGTFPMRRPSGRRYRWKSFAGSHITSERTEVSYVKPQRFPEGLCNRSFNNRRHAGATCFDSRSIHGRGERE